MDRLPNMNRRSLLIGMAAASTAAAPVALAAGAAAPTESPALLAAYAKLLAARAEYAAATDALEWLADEWRHRWPLAPEEILGGANAHIHNNGYSNSVERDIMGRPLMRDTTVLTKRLSRNFRRGRTCFMVDQPDDIEANLVRWLANEPAGRTEKALARKRATKARIVKDLRTKLPLARQYHDETKRLREVSGANEARQRVTAAKAACQAIEAEIGQLPALTMTGLAIKATLVKAMFEASNLQNLGGFFGDSYRLAVTVLDQAERDFPASSV